MLQLDPGVTDKLSRRLRKITRRLGTVRELDVLQGVIDELGTGKIRRYPAPALARVAASLGEDPGIARARVLDKVPIHHLWRVAWKLEKLAKTLETKGTGPTPPARTTTERGWRWAIDARLARRATALAAAVSDAGAVYLSERLHDVRIAVKKLRYALELSAEVQRVRSSPELRQLRRTQDILGRLHDLQVLLDRTREAQASLTPPDLTAWRELDDLVVSLDEDCRRLHGRYMNDRDALLALCARLSGHLDGKGQKARIKGTARA